MEELHRMYANCFSSIKIQLYVILVRGLVLWCLIYNISVISWQSVLLVEETGVLGENYRSVASHGQTLSHNVVSSIPHNERGSNSHLLL